MEKRWGLPLIAWPSRLRPNVWDMVALPLVLGVLALVAWGGFAMGARYEFGQALPISLDPWRLPEYALRTVLRMVAALIASLVFSLVYGALAAKSRQAEKILIPALDILQSVPILGFLSVDRHRVHRIVSGPSARRRMRCDFRDLHLAGLEHGVQRLSVAAHAAGRADRRGAHLPALDMAALLAPRSAARGTEPDLEHDDVGVGRLVFRCRLGSDHGRQPDDFAARHRLLHRDRDHGTRPRRNRLCPRCHAGRDPAL